MRSHDEKEFIAHLNSFGKTALFAYAEKLQLPKKRYARWLFADSRKELIQKIANAFKQRHGGGE